MNELPCDLAGVGFGPANLALAVALDEHNRGAPPGEQVSAVFFEKQQRFGWHRDMLIDGATVQVSFLKDLVTMRKPASEFSFLSYLHANGRLVDFINHKSLFPSRVEFNDYLEWVSRQFPHLFDYDAEVISTRPVVRDGEIDAVDVVVRKGGTTGELVLRQARNLVIAAGLRPHLPDGVTASDRIWHSDGLLTRLAERPNWSPRRVVVVGAGQSAAEIVEYLHRSYPETEVCAVFSRYGYTPADDSPFANRVFDPHAVDTFFNAGEDVKRMILDYHANTNYSVVDLPLIDELYRRVYQEKVSGRQRLRVLNLSRVAHARPSSAGVRVVIESLAGGGTDVLDADVVVYATGYRPVDPLDLLGELGELCLRDEHGRLRIGRNHRVLTADRVSCGVYLQGAAEHTHGLGSGLLSNVAIRAEEIMRAIAESTRRVPAGSNGRLPAGTGRP
jgi:L-ornithine N5-monooxygenase